MQRGLVESFNGRLRDECLSEHLFANLNVSRQIIEEWKIDYNTNRPPPSLNGFTPTEFATRPNGTPNQKIPGPAGVVLGALQRRTDSTTNSGNLRGRPAPCLVRIAAI